MRRSLWPLAILAVLAGCATKDEPSTENATTVTEATGALVGDEDLVFTLEGPGGKVSLGGSLDQAKVAYPAPDGAEIFDTTMGLSQIAPDGWAWQHQDEGLSFEVAVRDGKIVAMGLNTVGNSGPQLIAAIGAPSRQFEGESANAYVWEGEYNARFLIDTKVELMGIKPGAMSLMGPKEDLKMLNMRYDDPDTLIKQIDAMVEQVREIERAAGSMPNGG